VIKSYKKTKLFRLRDAVPVYGQSTTCFGFVCALTQECNFGRAKSIKA